MTDNSTQIMTDDCGLPYKITAKAARPDWKDHENCVLTISLGHDYHEGEKLESLVYWANKRFDHVIINLADTLHRHNLKTQDNTAGDALEAANRLGEEWLERNMPAITRQATKKLTIHRWAEWLIDETFEAHAAALEDHYLTAEPLRAAVASDIERFASRRKEAIPDFVRMQSRNYLMEEAVIYTLVARRYQPVRVYPATDLATLHYLANADIPETLRGLERACQVQATFYRRPSFWAARQAAENAQHAAA